MIPLSSITIVLLLSSSILIKESLSALTAAIYDSPYYGSIVDIVDKDNYGNKVIKSNVKNDVKEVIGITHSEINNRYYIISGYESGSQKLMEYNCNSNKEEFTLVGYISPSLLLSCLTSGPSGLYAVDLNSKKLGKMDVIKGSKKNTIKWNSISTLVGPYDAYALAQDPSGILHYINGDGKYYTTNNSNNNDIGLKEQKGIIFPTQRQGFCGDFIDDDNMVTSSYNENGGIVTYSLKDKTATQEFTAPAVLLNDVTRGPLCYDKNPPTDGPTAISTPPASSPIKVPKKDIKVTKKTTSPLLPPSPSPIKIPTSNIKVSINMTNTPNVDEQIIAPKETKSSKSDDEEVNKVVIKIIPELKVDKKGKEYIPEKSNVFKKSKDPPSTSDFLSPSISSIDDMENNIEIEYVPVLVPVSIPVPVQAPQIVSTIPVPVIELKIVPVVKVAVPATTIIPVNIESNIDNSLANNSKPVDDDNQGDDSKKSKNSSEKNNDKKSNNSNQDSNISISVNHTTTTVSGQEKKKQELSSISSPMKSSPPNTYKIRLFKSKVYNNDNITTYELSSLSNVPYNHSNISSSSYDD